MNNLVSEVCRILDFPEEYSDLAMKEAEYREKLHNVYMFVNGTLRWVSSYNKQDGLILANKVWMEVDTLDVWVPDTGVYTNQKDGTKILLVKRPMKQWKKSFTLDYYSIFRVYGDYVDEYDFNQYAKSECETIYQTNTSTIKAFKDVIGYIEMDNFVKCTKPEFYQEIIDYSTRKGLQWNVSL